MVPGDAEKENLYLPGQLTLNLYCSSAPNCSEKHGLAESVDYAQE
jgi:hypothetical protein